LKNLAQFVADTVDHPGVIGVKQLVRTDVVFHVVDNLEEKKKMNITRTWWYQANNNNNNRVASILFNVLYSNKCSDYALLIFIPSSTIIRTFTKDPSNNIV
jgi:hypothetical protein